MRKLLFLVGCFSLAFVFTAVAQGKKGYQGDRCAHPQDEVSKRRSDNADNILLNPKLSDSRGCRR